MGAPTEARVKWLLANPDYWNERNKRPEFRVWGMMRQRCLNTKTRSFKYYGARGITCAPQWKSFKQFLADVGPRPSMAHQLHRLGHTGNYEPGNVVWSVDHSEGF